MREVHRQDMDANVEKESLKSSTFWTPFFKRYRLLSYPVAVMRVKLRL